MHVHYHRHKYYVMNMWLRNRSLSHLLNLWPLNNVASFWWYCSNALSGIPHMKRPRLAACYAVLCFRWSIYCGLFCKEPCVSGMQTRTVSRARSTTVWNERGRLAAWRARTTSPSDTTKEASWSRCVLTALLSALLLWLWAGHRSSLEAWLSG